MLNWTLRYSPLSKQLDEWAAGSILDVGSGWHGVGTFRGGRIVHTDIDFSLRPEALPAVGSVAYVSASADRLPFADDAFDVVVSLDLIEHLPVALRQPALQEMFRVSRRRVAVGFPCSQPAERADERLAKSLKLFGRAVPEWLSEHLGQVSYPDRTTMLGAAPDEWALESERGLGNTNLLVGVSLAEALPVARTVTRLIDSWYQRRGPLAIVDRGRTYRRLWCWTRHHTP